MRPSESQLILPGMPVAPVTPASWLGVKGTRGAGRYRNHRWILFTDQGQPSGFQVFHCGHPTATYPYYAEFNGEPLPGQPNGLGCTWSFFDSMEKETTACPHSLHQKPFKSPTTSAY